MEMRPRISGLGPVPRGPGGPPEGHDYADYADYRKSFFFFQKKFVTASVITVITVIMREKTL
jgi:hypothetical protein